MKIRVAAISDVEAIASILGATSEVRSVADRGHDRNVAIIRDNLERVLGANSSTVFVAEVAGYIAVGYCAVHWTPFLFLEGGEAYITELFVLPQNRGHGIGTKLLDRVEDEARKRGCSRLSLLNGRESEAYKRGFYSKRNWIEREAMANFVLKIRD